METYNTLRQALEGLKKQGYNEDFNLLEDSIECPRIQLRLHPEEFEVDKVFRFEGDSSVDDSSAVYAISSSDNKTKGVLVTAYGTYAETASAELLRKLS